MRLSSVIDQLDDLKPKVKEKMFDIACAFEKNLPDNLYKDHYELASVTKVDVGDWQEFLSMAQVKAWIKKELATVVSANSRKAIKNLQNAENQTAVSGAKAMIELDKELSEQDNSVKFIYAHIPLAKKKDGEK